MGSGEFGREGIPNPVNGLSIKFLVYLVSGRLDIFGWPTVEYIYGWIYFWKVVVPII